MMRNLEGQKKISRISMAIKIKVQRTITRHYPQNLEDKKDESLHRPRNPKATLLPISSYNYYFTLLRSSGQLHADKVVTAC